MIADTATTPTPEQFTISDGTETALEFVVDPATGAGSLVLIGLDGSGAIEVPITREDALQMIAALCEYAYPGSRLRATAAAGNA